MTTKMTIRRVERAVTTRRRRASFAMALALAALPDPAFGEEIRVAPGADVQAAIDAAMPGDVVILEQGTHDATVRTARDGQPAAPIVLRGERAATLQAMDLVVDVQHAHFHIEDLVIDAQYADQRVMRVGDGGTGFQLVRSVVQHSRNHCIDIRNTADVTIRDSRIHHCLNWDGGRVDAHGISAQAVQNLTIRNTEIHTFTGDAVQVDPSRSAPGWDNVLIEGCTFWLAPVDDGAGGVPVGVVPGENALDTKTVDNVTGRLVVRDTTAYGFENGEISNMAAFNVKENVDVTFDRVTVYDSEIAFRLRGASGATPGATVSLTNVLIHDVATALRVESAIGQPIPVHHVTFGSGVVEFVDFADGATAADLDPQNVVVVGPAVPAELDGPGSFAATLADFEDIADGEYIPLATVPWLDAGGDLGVSLDRRGAMRPQGAGPEPGAFEFGDAPPEDMGAPPQDMGTSPDMGHEDDVAGAQSDLGGGHDGGAVGADSADAGGGCSCRIADAGPSSLVWLAGFVGARRVRRRRKARAH